MSKTFPVCVLEHGILPENANGQVHSRNTKLSFRNTNVNSRNKYSIPACAHCYFNKLYNCQNWIVTIASHSVLTLKRYVSEKRGILKSMCAFQKTRLPLFSRRNCPILPSVCVLEHETLLKQYLSWKDILRYGNTQATLEPYLVLYV